MLKIIDDFTDDIDDRLNHAMSLEFGPVEYLGVEYKNLSIHNESESYYKNISSEIGKNVEGWSIIRKGLNPTGWIHSDTSCGDYAALLYINDPERETGTAIWKHKKFGESSDNCKTQEDIDEVNGDSNDESKWELLKVIRGKKNRLIIYSSDTFHSCWKRSGCPERIIQCTFVKEVS